MNLTFIVGKIVLAFIVSVIPALLIRYFIAERRVGIWLSIGITVLLLFLNLILFATILPELRIPSGFVGLSAGVSFFILRHRRKERTFTDSPEKARLRSISTVICVMLLIAGIIIGVVLGVKDNLGNSDPNQAWQNRGQLGGLKTNNPALARKLTVSVGDYLHDPFQAVFDGIESSGLMVVVCLLCLVRAGFPVAMLINISTINDIARDAGAGPPASLYHALVAGLIIAGIIYGGIKLIEYAKPDIARPQKSAEHPKVSRDALPHNKTEQ